MNEFNKKIKILEGFREREIHDKFIEYIRYPRFRNLEDNTRVDFNFPITFLVGKNGGGKSSTLQSLYGCPQGYSLGEYWFTTELDPIKEFESERNCFIYGYKSNNLNNEVLKQRIYRENNPDYWEPSKPIKKYGMLPKRFSPISKNVIYLDFRSELSAFDKFMHFLKYSSKAHKTKQDFLRFYSKKLKLAFDNDVIIDYYKPKRNKKKINLSVEEVSSISNILGKNFSSIELIEHDLFKDWGVSIRLKSPELSYSEAFAGSGETAIVILVHKIFNAENESLILLDEPETSLHSGAQKRLMNFILDICIKKKHQLVISTHSPFLIENMPDNSIKVFTTIKSTGKFVINPERNYKEAFHELEVINNEKKTILVEDKFAKLILDKILDKIGKATKSLFEVKYLPGGASDINQRITTLMEFSESTFVFFDGDQKLLENHIDLSTINQNQQDTSKKIKDLIKSQTGCDIKFYLDGGNKDNEEQEIMLGKKYLNFYKEKVFYLPLSIPEDIIWDENFANSKLRLLFPDKNISDIIKNSKDSKDKLFNLCMEIYEDSTQMDSIYIEFITNWINKADENKNYIEDLLTKIK